MTKDEFKERIQGLALEVIKDRKKSEIAAVEYDELTKFPELKKVIVDLLTLEYDNLHHWYVSKHCTSNLVISQCLSYFLHHKAIRLS